MDVKDLLKKSNAELDELFRGLDAGPIPDGPAKGTAILAPGTSYTDELAELVNIFAWQGKVFDAKRGVLRNKILPIGLNAIVATVYKEKSWLDQNHCIVHDYSETSLVAKSLRDELRMIAPRFYLGQV